MWFLVVFNQEGKIVSNKASLSQLFAKYDFGNYVGNVIQFTRSAGIGDYMQIQDCVIVRTK